MININDINLEILRCHKVGLSLGQIAEKLNLPIKMVISALTVVEKSY